MVAEAIAVIGAISGTVSTINTVKGWLIDIVKICQDVAESGNTIRDLSTDFDAFGCELVIWMDFWVVKEGTSIRYLRELWRQHDLESILDQLASIQALSQRFADLLLQFFSPPSKSANPHNPFRKGKQHSAPSSKSVYDQPFLVLAPSVTQYLDTATKIKKTLSLPTILKFVNLTYPILKRQMTELQQKLTLLRGRALNAYNIKHPIALSGISSKELDPAKTANLLRLVLESRLASSAVYRSFLSLSQSILGTQLDRAVMKPLYLELDLVRNEDMLEIMKAPPRQCLSLGFFFLVSWPAKLLEMPLELFLEGPLPPESTNEKETSFSMDALRQACELALEGKTLGFKLPSGPGNGGNPLGFRSRTPPPEERMVLPKRGDQNSGSVLLKPLQTLIYNLGTTYYDRPVEQFPLSERYRLAFKIAECGLILCGTSWFSGLGIQHVHRSQKDVGKPRRYLLETQIGGAKLSKDDPATLQPHIFAVGRLLVEIATGHIILRTLPLEDRQDFDYEVSDDGDTGTDQSGVPRTGEELFAEVENGMGGDYGRAVEFCLRRVQPGIHWQKVRKSSGEEQRVAYHEILKAYYAVVYQPLQKLVQGHDLAGDGPNSMEG